jgi:heavy metal sensor kinase
VRLKSIQFRLTVWYAAALALALCLFAFLIEASLRQRLVNDLDQDVADSAGRFEAYFQKEAAKESGDNLRGELDEYCEALPAANYVSLSGGGFEFHYPERGPRQRNVRTYRTRFQFDGVTYDLETGASTHAIHRTIELLRWLLLSLIPVAVAVACFGGAWLSRRALRPVDEITSAARTIEIDNLSQRLPVPETGDEIQRLAEVWNSMLARLEAAVKTLSQFAADASHELRTPLAVIRTSAELALRRARAPEEYRASLEEVSVEAERMTKLVEDLLFLARSASQPVVDTQPVELRGVLDGVASELRDLARTKDIGVEVTGDPVTVAGNPAALRRLFLVLLDNAIKYSGFGKPVAVGIVEDADRTTVRIEDHGIGIPAADLPHIFQRFYRADKARTDGGYGLGLSIASTIAQAHGASVEAASTEGKGSVFSVVFRRS